MLSNKDKKLRGTHKPSRDLVPKEQLPKTDRDKIVVPPFLKDKPKAIEFYRAILGYLKDQNALSDKDDLACAMCAYWADRFAAEAIRVDEYGSVEHNPKSGTKLTGYYLALNIAENNLTKWMRELGLTPKAREKIRAFMNRPDTQEDDPLNMIMK